jgi:hypothetical protein
MSQFLFWDTERIRLSLFPQQSGHGHHRPDMMVVTKLSSITLHTASQELRGGTGLAVAAYGAK